MKKLDLKVGFSCNNNCVFCAQAHRRNQTDNSFDELVQEMEEGFSDGCNQIVFTGGEPTVRDDIIDLVETADSIGFEHIQIQSNGRMFYYKEFCKKIIEAGATEFSPAIHGHTAEIHEAGTRAKGSFKQTYNGIKNLVELDQYVLTNTVINKFNYEHLPEIADMLLDLGVSQIQFAFVHPCGNAWKNFKKVVPRKSDAEPYIHEALDRIEEDDQDIRVMVEAYPYCFMEGYEDRVSQLYIPPGEIRGQEEIVEDFETVRQEADKVKAPKCRDCRFFKVCEGPWKEYPQVYGFDEFEPVEGEEVESKEDVLGGNI